MKSAFEAWRSDFQLKRVTEFFLTKPILDQNNNVLLDFPTEQANMENAFDRVVESNYKHINARVKSAVNLLNSVFKRQVRATFGEIYLTQGRKTETMGHIYKDLIN